MMVSYMILHLNEVIMKLNKVIVSVLYLGAVSHLNTFPGNQNKQCDSKVCTYGPTTISTSSMITDADTFVYGSVQVAPDAPMRSLSSSETLRGLTFIRPKVQSETPIISVLVSGNPAINKIYALPFELFYKRHGGDTIRIHVSDENNKSICVSLVIENDSWHQPARASIKSYSKPYFAHMKKYFPEKHQSMIASNQQKSFNRMLFLQRFGFTNY